LENALAIWQKLNSYHELTEFGIVLSSVYRLNEMEQHSIPTLKATLQRASDKGFIGLQLTVIAEFGQHLLATGDSEHAVALIAMVRSHPSCNRSHNHLLNLYTPVCKIHFSQIH
jgi:hypothetical protein